MMRGTVNAGSEAIVRLRVRRPSGVEKEVDAIVDSGFSASLTLPAATVATLGLPRQTGGEAELADGAMCQFDICAAEVLWCNTWRTVLVSAVGNESLLGMLLMANHKLAIDVKPGGVVEIVPLP